MNSRTDRTDGIAFRTVASDGDPGGSVILRAFGGVPGPWTWAAIGLAMVLVTLSIIAWWQNDRMVVWLLTNGVADEASTRTLPGIIDFSALVGLIVGSIVIGSSTVFRMPIASASNLLLAGSVAIAGFASRTVVLVWTDIVTASSLVAREMVRLWVALEGIAASLKLLIERISRRVASDARILGGAVSAAAGFVWRYVARAAYVVGALILALGLLVGWVLLYAWRRISRIMTITWEYLAVIGVALHSGARAIVIPPAQLLASMYRNVRHDIAIAATAAGRVINAAYRMTRSAVVIFATDIGHGIQHVAHAVAWVFKAVALGIGIATAAIYLGITGLATTVWAVVVMSSVATWGVISMAALKVGRATEIALTRTGAFVYAVIVGTGRVVSAIVHAIALGLTIASIMVARAISTAIAWTYGLVSSLSSRFWDYLTQTVTTIWRVINIAAHMTANIVMRTVRPPAYLIAIAFIRVRHGLFVAAVAVARAAHYAYLTALAATIRALRTLDSWARVVNRAIGIAVRYLYGRAAMGLSVTVHAIGRWISIAFHAIGSAIGFIALLAMLGTALAAIAFARTVALIARPVRFAITMLVRYAQLAWRFTIAALLALEKAVLVGLSATYRYSGLTATWIIRVLTLILNALISANKAFFNAVWRGLKGIASAIKSSALWAVDLASRGLAATALAVAVSAVFVALVVAAGIKYLLLGLATAATVIGTGLTSAWAATVAFTQWTGHVLELASRPFVEFANRSWALLVRAIAAGDELVSRGLNGLRRGAAHTWRVIWDAIVLAGNTVGPPLKRWIIAIDRAVIVSVTTVSGWISAVTNAGMSALAAAANATGSGIAWTAARISRVITVVTIALVSILVIIITYPAIGIAWVARHVFHAIAVASTAVGIALLAALAVVGIGIAWAAGHVFHAIAMASTAVGSVLLVIAAAIGSGIAKIATLAYMAIAVPVGWVWGDLKRVGPPIGRALEFAWRQFGKGASGAWDGVVLATRLGLLGLRYLLWPFEMLAKGVLHTPGFIVYNMGIGFGVIPDLREAGVRRMGGSTTRSTDDLNLVARRIIPLAVMVWVAALGMAFMVNWMWPEPAPPTVTVDHWATGHLFFDGGLEEMAARFNAMDHRSESGNRIVARVHNNPSSLQTEDLLSRVLDGKRLPRECCGPGPEPHVDPTIITPSSAHWIIPMNDALIKAGITPVIDLNSASTTRPIALAYIGIVTYQGMAECLGWPAKKIGFEEIIALSNDERGWDSCPTASAEWGKKPLVAFTDPRESSTGRSVLLALYSIASEAPPEEIDMKLVRSDLVTDRVKEFAGLIDHYMIGTSVLNTKIHQGPRFGHFFLMPEDNLIHLKEGTVSAFFGGVKQGAPPHEAPMVMIYPKEGTLARNNCACLVTAPWVDAEEAAAAELWIDYLQEEQQQRAFMRAGFRPVTGIPLLPNDPDNRITAEFGLNPETPSKILDVSKIQPEVANEIDRRWEDVKRQSVVTFVVDTSGSMLVGGKLDKAKDGLTRALFNMPSNNKAGLVTFDDAVRTASPVNPLNGDARASLENAVKNMKAGGETALYDAIEIGIRMTDAADGDEDAIRAVVVLTDGQANLGATQLDHLVMMSSRDNEVPIRTFPGYFDHDAPMDAQGRTVAKNNVTGTGMILETTHDIQIFFIGIGDDADLDIGRILAEATGAEFQGVTEDDLANVLEELAGYF